MGEISPASTASGVRMGHARQGLGRYLRCADRSSPAAQLEVAPVDEIERLSIPPHLAKFEEGSAAERGGVDHFPAGVVAKDRGVTRAGEKHPVFVLVAA